MCSRRCLPGNWEDITGGGGRRHAESWGKCTVAEGAASAKARGQGGPRHRMQSCGPELKEEGQSPGHSRRDRDLQGCVSVRASSQDN